MSRAFSVILALVVNSALCCSAVLAEDGQRQFDQLYGQEYRAVSATADRADDAELARKLLDAAGQPGVRGELMAVLCDRAHLLGTRGEAGYDIAIEAMKLLAEKVPARRAECGGRILRILTRRYAAARGDARALAANEIIRHHDALADEAAEAGEYAAAAGHLAKALDLATRTRSEMGEALGAKRKLMIERGRIERELAALEKRLTVNSEDLAARRRIVRLLVVDKDDPNAAAPWVEAGLGEPWKTYVPLAAKAPGSLAPAVCRELGDWYGKLAEGAPAAASRTARERAKTYYEVFLAKAAPNDPARPVVRLALDKIAKAIGYQPTTALPIGAGADIRLTGALTLVSNPADVPGATGWTLETRTVRGPIRTLAFSPDANSLAVGGVCGTIRILHSTTGALVRILVGHESDVRKLAYLAGGVKLVSAGGDRTVRLWNAATGKCLGVLRGKVDINDMAVSPDGRFAATANEDGAATVWDLASGRAVSSLQKAHAAGVSAIAWSHDGKWIATGGGQADGKVCIWDAVTKRRLHTIDVGLETVGALAWSPDNGTLAIGDGKLKGRGAVLWHAATKKIGRTLSGGLDRKTCALAWSPDGTKLAIRGEKGVDVLVAETGRLAESTGIGSDVTAIAWSADGKLLAACDPARHVALQRLAAKQFLWWFEVKDFARIGAVAWTADLERIAIKGGGGKVSVRDVATAAPTGEVAVGGYPRRLGFSPNGKLLAHNQEKELRLFDGDTAKEVRKFGYTKHEARVAAFAWSPDSRRIALVPCYWGPTMVFDVASGKRLRDLKGYRAGSYYDLAWSPNGRMVALAGLGEGGKAKNVAIWQVDTGRYLGLLTAPGDRQVGGNVTCIAWAPDNMRVVGGSGDKTVLIWDLRKGRPIRPLSGAAQQVNAVAWSPDGAMIAAAELPARGAADIRLWDAPSGKPGGMLQGHEGTILGLKFSRDGRSMASASKRLVRIWDVASKRARMTYVPIKVSDGVTVSAAGHFRVSKGVDPEKDLVYVVRTAGGQETLSPSQFAAKFGWKNDPAKLGR